MIDRTDLELSDDEWMRLDEMESEQACEWGEVPDGDAGGPMPRRMAHLTDVLVRKIAMPAEVDAPLGVLTRRQVGHWATAAMGVPKMVLGDEWCKEVHVGEDGAAE